MQLAPPGETKEPYTTTGVAAIARHHIAGEGMRRGVAKSARVAGEETETSVLATPPGAGPGALNRQVIGRLEPPFIGRVGTRSEGARLFPERSGPSCPRLRVRDLG